MASKPPPSDALAPWLAERRWFGGKRKRITAIDVEDSVDVGPGTLHVLRATLDDGEVQRYAVPLTPGGALGTVDDHGASRFETVDDHGASRFETVDDHGASRFIDALDDARFVHGLLDVVRREARIAGRVGAITGHRARTFDHTLGDAPSVHRLGGEQSNTSLVVGDALMLKHFRRLTPGLNPDLEITRFLTDTAHFPHTPALAGWLEYVDARGDVATLAIFQSLVRDARDGWEWVLGAMRESDGARTIPALRRLGEATAALHLALVRATTSEPALAPEPATNADLADWITAIAAQLVGAQTSAPAGVTVPAVAPNHLATALAALRGRVKSRHHGDFHLGQTLYREATGAWTIIDFEGEPLRPLEERRQKRSPLRDVAGMLRSLAYAAETTRAAAPGAWIDIWEASAREAFLDGYLATAAGAPFLPTDRGATRRAVAAFEVEKAAYEVVYEANNRPDWIAIPLRGLARATAALAPATASGAA